MSPDSYQLFNTWFPAIVVGLVISLLAAVLWDLLRRKTWCFASRFWPGILKEVGLDTSSPSRADVEDKNREISEALSNLSSQITKALVPAKSSMAETIDSTCNCNSFVSSKCGVTGDFDLEAQIGINPVYTPNCSNSITFLATAYFPDDTPMVVIRPTKKLFKRYSKGTVKRWKSSIVLQASLPIDPCVLAEIGNLAKHCMHMEYRCTFQLGNWAILYCNAGEVHLHILKEGDVPVNVEAKWQADRTGITMRGLYLNGAQVKAATKLTSTILRSVGPAAQGPGELDELHFPIGELDVPGKDSLIFAAKIVEVDGVSLIVRSEASFILPPREKFSFIEALWGQLEWISISARKMMKSFLTAEDRQAETTTNRSTPCRQWRMVPPDLNHCDSARTLESGSKKPEKKTRPEMRFDLEHSELILQHWKGVSEIELLENRKEVLHYLHELRESGIVDGASSQPPETHLRFIRDVAFHQEYWQRGLQDVNEVLLQRRGRLQIGTQISSIRGGLKFLCGDFESALQDLDVAYQIMREPPSTVLVERALVKCMLARYSEALEDVGTVIAINPNENNIQELQTCIQQILDQRTPIRRIQDDQEPRLSDQDNRMVTIPDLLTGDEWHSGEIESPCTMSDDITDGDWAIGQPVECGDKMKRHSTSGLEEPGPSQTRRREKSQEVLELGHTDALGSFNVFLHHRGPDHVKKTFVAHLKKALCVANAKKTFVAHSKEALCVANAESTDLAQARGAAMVFTMDISPLKLQLKLTNYADALESNPRYHVRRISFIAEAAARAADAGFPYYNLQNRFNFRDSPLFLREIPGDHSDEEEDNAVEKEAHRLAVLMPSSAWIPDNWCYCITSPEEVTSSPPWDIGHINNKESSDSVIASANILCWHEPWLRNQWTSDGFAPPLMDSVSELDTNFDVQCSTSYGSGVLREIVGSSPEEDLSRCITSRTGHCFVIQQPFCSCDEESGMPENQSLLGFDRCNNTTSNSDGRAVHGSSPRLVASTDLVIFPRQFNAFLDKRSQRRCRCSKDCPSRFDYQHHQSRGASHQLQTCTAYQPPETSSDPRSQEGCVVAPARTGTSTSDGNGRDGHCYRGARTKARTTHTGSGRKPGTSQYYGVRFRPDLNKWVGEIRVAEWKAVGKKVWLGTFDTEQAAARGVDLARKLLKCMKKHPVNLPCEKLEAYSRQIPPHLLTYLTGTSMFKEVTLFVKHECQEYAASFDDTPTGQSGLERQTLSTAIQDSSSAGQLAHNSDSPPIFATKLLQGIQFEELQPSCDDVPCPSGRWTRTQKAIKQVNVMINHNMGLYTTPTTTSSGTQEHQVACDLSPEAGLLHDWRQVSSTPSLDLTSNSRKLRRMNTERESELSMVS